MERSILFESAPMKLGYTITYVRTNGQWLCVLAQLLPVAPQHYPADDTIVVKYLRGQLQ